jgi:hypothetical protein
MRRNHENARAWSVLVPLSLAAALGLGCSGEFPSESAPATDAADNELIESYLARHGYDTSDLQFGSDLVVVEGDMGMARADLLEAAEAEASGVVEKGYFIPTNRLFAGNKIRLSFGASVSQAWRDAYSAAIIEWNSKVPKFAFVGGPGSPATIQVNKGRPNPPILNSSIALATNPPNRTITLNENFAGASACPGKNIETLSAAVKKASAVHEIGHVLGFTHPPPLPTDGVRIAGTAATMAVSDPTKQQTVMDSGCDKTLSTLTMDDVLSATKKYPAPSCRELCEFNCTFNVDPVQIGLCQAACPQQCGG